MTLTTTLVYQLPAANSTEGGENITEVFSFPVAGDTMSISTYDTCKANALARSWLKASPTLKLDEDLIQYNTTITY